MAKRAPNVRLQQLLPDGRHAMVMRRSTTQSGPISIVDELTGDQTPLNTPGFVEVRYADGYLVSVLPNGNVQATPFDPGRRQITGAAVTLGGGVSVTGTGVAQLAVAANGTIAYIVEEPPVLAFVDRRGTSRTALAAAHSYPRPRFSPDGRRVAFDFIAADGRDVWILSIADGTLSRASF